MLQPIHFHFSEVIPARVQWMQKLFTSQDKKTVFYQCILCTSWLLLLTVLLHVFFVQYRSQMYADQILTVLLKKCFLSVRYTSLSTAQKAICAVLLHAFCILNKSSWIVLRTHTREQILRLLWTQVRCICVHSVLFSAHSLWVQKTSAMKQIWFRIDYFFVVPFVFTCNAQASTETFAWNVFCRCTPHAMAKMQMLFHCVRSITWPQTHLLQSTRDMRTIFLCICIHVSVSSCTHRWITNTKQWRIRILWFDVLYNDHPLHHMQMVQHFTRMRQYIFDLHFAVIFLSVMHPRCSTYWTSNANRFRHQEKFLHTKILSMISLRHMHMHMLSQWFL